MTKSAIIVFCACADHEEAERIARALVEDRLAACVNLLPGIESIYRWKGNVETASEVLLLIKTNERRFVEIRDRIRELHSYEVPEIVAVPISAGAEEYLGWLAAETEPGA